MIVDPNTGIPIGVSQTPMANSMAGQIGMDAADSFGYTQDDIPLFYDVASSLPSAAATTGWNINRVSNTIVGGGRAKAVRGTRGVRQTFSPAAQRRLARGANIDPSFYNELGYKPGGKPGVYSPFNFLARSGNWSVRQAQKYSMGRNLAAKMGAKDGLDAFSTGTAGRIAAGGRIASMSDEVFAQSSRNIFTVIDDIRPGQVLPASRSGAQAGMLNTITGTVSGRTAGFVRGAESLAQGRAAGSMRGFYETRALLTNNAAIAGYESGGRFAASRIGTSSVGNYLLKKGAISGAARAAGPIGWMLLAKDIATMSGKLAGAAVATMADAGDSFKGSLDKPVFGMGFKDNTIAATSRQRGVQAISNSRLNMRSALGSEAAYIHAAFG